eukprot:TRINITY_DN2906_c0_g1_i1.p1 TRINITY_DN2906_c0_g1~~TRINITY_DN2906_c0_g1_i1.p1  ORF type:complete len:771 (-),score=263.65 TRINITY_DN2906_c0_g1_i1:118-2400(-)
MNAYQVMRTVGKGSFGQAKLVRHRETRKQYIIKTIQIENMGANERREALNEIRVLSQLNHPFIVRYRDSFVENRVLHIVMDYAEKGDLHKMIKERSTRGVLFSEDQIWTWFVQMCLALKHVHDRKILHRDLKTQNIFLTKDRNVAMGDFGIARVLKNTMDCAHTAIGTPYYLSPEICEDKPYNNKSDIWSLGCVLYEMATLKHAFTANSMKGLVARILKGSYPPISSKYSPELSRTISVMLQRNPASRPSINQLLRMPALQRRVRSLLSQTLVRAEFSHTIIHNKGIDMNNADLPDSVARLDPDYRRQQQLQRQQPNKNSNAASAVKRSNVANVANVAQKSIPKANNIPRPISRQSVIQRLEEERRKRREQEQLEKAKRAEDRQRHQQLLEEQRRIAARKQYEENKKLAEQNKRRAQMEPHLIAQQALEKMRKDKEQHQLRVKQEREKILEERRRQEEERQRKARNDYIRQQQERIRQQQRDAERRRKLISKLENNNKRPESISSVSPRNEHEERISNVEPNRNITANEAKDEKIVQNEIVSNKLIVNEAVKEEIHIEEDLEQKQEQEINDVQNDEVSSEVEEENAKAMTTMILEMEDLIEAVDKKFAKEEAKRRVGVNDKDENEEDEDDESESDSEEIDEESMMDHFAFDRKVDLNETGHFKMLGKTLKLPKQDDNTSLLARIESLYIYLEEALGSDVFVQCYHKMKALEDILETEETEEKETTIELLHDEIEKLLNGQLHFVNVLNQLLYCQDRFNNP